MSADSQVRGRLKTLRKEENNGGIDQVKHDLSILEKIL
jgi:hypothetical protein